MWLRNLKETNEGNMLIQIMAGSLPVNKGIMIVFWQPTSGQALLETFTYVLSGIPQNKSESHR